MHEYYKKYNTSQKRKHRKVEECQEYCKVQISRTPAQLRSMTTNRKKSVLKILFCFVLLLFAFFFFLVIFVVASDGFFFAIDFLCCFFFYQRIIDTFLS